MCWTSWPSDTETCCNKDSNDLFDQLFLLLWIHEWYFPTSFQATPRLCAKKRRRRGKTKYRRSALETITRESGCHQRESRAKQDRDHPAVMVTEPDQQQGTIRENDAGSSLKSLIFPSQGGSLHKMKSYFDATLIPPPDNELKGPSTAARRFQYWEI